MTDSTGRADIEVWISNPNALVQNLAPGGFTDGGEVETQSKPVEKVAEAVEANSSEFIESGRRLLAPSKPCSPPTRRKPSQPASGWSQRPQSCRLPPRGRSASSASSVARLRSKPSSSASLRAAETVEQCVLRTEDLVCRVWQQEISGR
jgi:hypothetical protein